MQEEDVRCALQTNKHIINITTDWSSALKVGEMNVEQSRRTQFWTVVVMVVAFCAKQQWQDSLVNGHSKN